MQPRDGPAVAQPAHKNVRPCRFLTAGNLSDQWDLGRLFLRRKVAMWALTLTDVIWFYWIDKR
jgi:hypothetical protein